MNKKYKNLLKFIFFLPFIFIFLFTIVNAAFLPLEIKEVIVEGKYKTLPYSLLVKNYSVKSSYYEEKVANHPEEFFLGVRYNKNLYVIQTTENIYDKTEKNNKINVNLKTTRLTHKVEIEHLGINPLSDSQLAQQQEEIRNIIKQQLKK